jgi:hypothetical protein
VSSFFTSQGGCIPCHPGNDPDVYVLASLKANGAVVPCDSGASTLVRELVGPEVGQHGSMFPAEAVVVDLVRGWIDDLGAPP